MPTSDSIQISKIIGLIRKKNPSSILDIGPGFGKYGLLCREYLEIWNRKAYSKEKWKIRIDAIEVFKEYITPIHEYIYNNILIGNAKKLITEINLRYDLILLIDVLEHFNKKDGNKLIKDLRRISNSILLSIPKNIGTQGIMFNNKFEEHKGQWSKEELIISGAKFFLEDDNKYICLIE